GYPQPQPRILFTDSKDAQSMALNPLNPARTRTIDIRYKWIIEQVSLGRFKVEHVSGRAMPADG
ncbi:hypothetical protein QBC44DRAFT_215937, partial [Cladorrhinum sp. PSN332]